MAEKSKLHLGALKNVVFFSFSRSSFSSKIETKHPNNCNLLFRQYTHPLDHMTNDNWHPENDHIKKYSTY